MQLKLKVEHNQKGFNYEASDVENFPVASGFSPSAALLHSFLTLSDLAVSDEVLQQLVTLDPGRSCIVDAELVP